MGELQLLKSVIALNNIRQELGEIVTSFYGCFHKSVNKIDQRVSHGEICHIFYKSLNLQNKVFKKFRNSYHVEDINILEKLVIRTK